jgi:hypothetical protein
MNRTGVGYFLRWAMLAGLLGSTWPAAAQQAVAPAGSPPDTSLSDSVRELRQQIQELQAAVAEIRSEAQQYRTETAELRRQLESVRAAAAPQTARVAESAAPAEPSSYELASGTPPAAPHPEVQQAGRSATLEEEYQLLSGKVDDQYQTKVESGSRYRVRLSGIVLLNLFSNRGTVDNIDYPVLAFANPPGSSGGNLGATLRQSQIGFEVFGPQLAGARTRADLQLDLGGGFPFIANGVNAGLLRLRTGTMRMDWNRTSIVAGQDGLFFSPLSPTSFASLAVPALSYAGNLWSWVPQVRVEHRISLGEASQLVLQGGILDPVSGEPPTFSASREPQDGEASRQPAYASRVAWVHNVFGQPLRVGFGGYYSRQTYLFQRNVDAWAGMTDLDLPLSHHFSLSGKLYRGRALGGLGGGIGRSVLFSGDSALSTTLVRALNSVGGWAQLKYRATSTLEFNGAFGQDNPYAADVRAFPHSQSYGDPTLVRNRGSFVNVIYRPRSDLLFAAEYHRARTFTINDTNFTADHINLSIGVLF